jgi:hypothetical protein
MKNRTRFLPIIGFLTLAGFQSLETCAAETGLAPNETSTATAKPFMVFDNMPKAAKMDGAAAGMAPCTIIGIPWIETNRVADVDALKAKVREIVKHPKYAHQPGLLVLDIEYVHDFRLFINLAKWVHEAAPGHPVGYYGHGLFPERPSKEQQAEADELAATVDAFLPSMYNFDDNREGWKNKLTALVQQAHRIAPGKPVYPYMWPGYHGGTRKAMRLLTGDYWKYQLETARECGADGLVIWGNPAAHWDDKSTWRQDTLDFIASKPIVESQKTPAISKAQAEKQDQKRYGD